MVLGYLSLHDLNTSCDIGYCKDDFDVYWEILHRTKVMLSNVFNPNLKHEARQRRNAPGGEVFLQDSCLHGAVSAPSLVAEFWETGQWLFREYGGKSEKL